jgi:hypothetical protein
MVKTVGAGCLKILESVFIEAVRNYSSPELENAITL